MENAIWKGEIISASQVSNQYELYKRVKIASDQRELQCPDPNCKERTLCYKSGSTRIPHFAHLSASNCDYAMFDKRNARLRPLEHMLGEHFKKQRYEVVLEANVLPHHYTHLLVTMKNGNKVAVELGTQQTSASTVVEWEQQYKEKKVKLQWIVISDSRTVEKENKAFFLQRYLLNETEKKNLLMLDWNGSQVTQIVIDSELKKTYLETALLQNLVFEEGMLTIEGFHDRHQQWRERKKVQVVEDQPFYNPYISMNHLKQNDLSGSIKQPRPFSNLGAAIRDSKKNDLSTYRDQLLSSTQSVYHDGYPLRLCLHCNKVGKAMHFDPYTFYNKSRNLGRCKKCQEDNIPKLY